MAKIIQGVGGVNRELKQIFEGVGGVNRELKERWEGVNGVNRKVFGNNEPQFPILFEKGVFNQSICGGYNVQSSGTGYWHGIWIKDEYLYMECTSNRGSDSVTLTTVNDIMNYLQNYNIVNVEYKTLSNLYSSSIGVGSTKKGYFKYTITSDFVIAQANYSSLKPLTTQNTIMLKIESNKSDEDDASICIKKIWLS